jgi:ribose transport system ATP-binding protein/rhamnose transport system ATP-binding protein
MQPRLTTEAVTPAGPVVVRLEGLRKAYGDTLAVRGADLVLRAGQVHAICGHNGAGKSTMVRMLSGQEKPDAGTIEIAGEPCEFRNRRAAQAAGIALVDQELSVVPALTVAENLVLGDHSSGWLHRRRAVRARARLMLAEVGLHHIDPDQPLSTISLGERQLVEIARAFGQEARVIILDEPTATLSDVESERVYSAVRRVAAAGSAVLFVSHRLGEVLDLCDQVTVMRDGAVVVDTPAKELTVNELIRHMLGETPTTSSRTEQAVEQREPVLRLVDLAVPRRFEKITLDAQPGTIYAFAGQVGSGAADVLRAVAGLEPSVRGHIVLGDRRVRLGSPLASSRAGIAFASGDRKSEGLFLGRTVGVNLLATRIPSLSGGGFVRPRLWRQAERGTARICDLSPLSATRVGTLSGGNQQKVFVGRSMGRSDVKVMILDEPTRGVDVGGRANIHELVRRAAAEGLVVLFSSTELDELLDLADVVVTMHKGQVVAEHRGLVSDDVLLYEMTHGSAAKQASSATSSGGSR